MTVSRIQTLPTRFPDLGRLRAGYKEANGKMVALRNWRLTSSNEDALLQVSHLYGGTVRKWDGKAGQFEIFTESDTLDIELPDDPLFTAYEKWGSGGCARRCDGERCTVPVQDAEGGHLDEVDCWCTANNRIPGEHKDACAVTVRLKVVLPRIQGLGVWMFTSGSIYAAMELPSQVDAIDALRRHRSLRLPCDLRLDYREEKRAYEKFARKYSVPSIRVNQSIEQITALLAPIDMNRSLVPGRVARELGAGDGPGARSDQPGLAESPGEPADGPEDAVVLDDRPTPITQAAWTNTQVRNLCAQYEIPMGATMRESIQNLVAAEIIIVG